MSFFSISNGYYAEMRNSIDLKAIGYGLATFVVGQLLVRLLGAALLGSAIATSQITTWILGATRFIVTVIAGFISAYDAHSCRIMNGTLGGSLGIVLLVIFFGPYFITFLSWKVPFLFVVIYVLGAILGSYWAGKHGN
jgi:hypothetical protein